jgi:succinate dehydrogenase/fumarate reductase iron-sulfur protein
MKLKIQKYNPMVDPEPYYVEGEVEYRPYISALDAIYLFHTQVEAINFDYACGGRICGRCACLIDGDPKMLCTAVLDDTAHVIEPLPGYPVIRDLVVDKSSLDDAISNIANRVMIEPVTKATVAPKDFAYSPSSEDLLFGAELCCRCGMCNVTCPARQVRPDDYAGPAQMLAVGYRNLDWYDKADRVAQAVSLGMYHCIMCGTCTSVCPHKIDHVGMWTTLREAAEARDLVPSWAQ